jgi:hypothetical protein
MAHPFPCQMQPVCPLDHVRAVTLVSGLLEEAESAVLPLDVVVGSGGMMPAQRDDDLLEALGVFQPVAGDETARVPLQRPLRAEITLWIG